ncbi:MAG: hypothetical protein IJG33_10080 [Selenomonadaceae bacterium]|nr:hypothetical protein [Selenomonadaceae bacterium]
MKRPCIAFKLNYCNGGSSSERVGFCGTCQDNIRWFNSYENKARDLWCRHPNCACRRYYEENSFPEEFICNECTALRDWKFSVGNDKPQRIRHAKENHLCLLTTVRPNMPEYDRVVFALFIIEKIFRGDDEHAGCVEADKHWRLEFRPREVHLMNFWSIYPDSSKSFGGLFRYFDDATAIKFLEQAVEVKRGTPEEDFAKEFFKQYPYK